MKTPESLPTPNTEPTPLYGSWTPDWTPEQPIAPNVPVGGEDDLFAVYRPRAISPTEDTSPLAIFYDQEAAPLQEAEPRTRRLAATAGRTIVAGTVLYAGARFGHAGLESLSGHTPDAAGISVLGLRRWTREARRDKREQDKFYYRDSAEASLKKMNQVRNPVTGKLEAAPIEPYSPLAGFDKTHMQPRAPYGAKPPKSDDPKPREARTANQAMTSMRHNTRVHAIAKRKNRAHMLGELYEEFSLGNKKVLKQELAATRMTHSQRKSIAKTGREYRKLNRTNERILRRLDHGEKGTDVAGHYLAAREVDDQVGEAIRSTTKRAAKGTARGLSRGTRSLKNSVGDALARRKAARASKRP